jgi:hypothetical protein
LEPGADAPLIRFNNDPNTTLEDVQALLTGVKQIIEADIPQ